MQDFYNPLFMVFFIRNNKLTVNLSQIFLHNIFNDIEDIVIFFPIVVYPVVFVVFACHEFSVAKGSITGNASNDLRASEPEEKLC